MKWLSKHVGVLKYFWILMVAQVLYIEVDIPEVLEDVPPMTYTLKATKTPSSSKFLKKLIKVSTAADDFESLEQDELLDLPDFTPIQFKDLSEYLIPVFYPTDQILISREINKSQFCPTKQYRPPQA